jgi:hypothetical protein
VLDIKDHITQIIKRSCSEKFFIYWYGAYDLDPKYLVYWVCVKTDNMKAKLESDRDLNSELRQLLEAHEYPIEAREFVHLGFESQETVDKKSGGNWYQHFK